MTTIRILAIDSSSTPASVAIVEDGRILSEFFLHTKLTHSQTLMPMVKAVLDITGTTSPDLIAVTDGPGSFTGVRIGIASAKGLALPRKVPCVGISSLELLAYNFYGSDKTRTICALMDARCAQAYNAFFRLEKGGIRRLCDDCVRPIAEIAQDAKEYTDDLILVGDCAAEYRSLFPGAAIAPENNRYQRASSAAFAAIHKNFCTAAELQPVYLQLPQAQRELNKKREQEK